MENTFKQYGLDPKGSNELTPVLHEYGVSNTGGLRDRNAYNIGLEKQYQSGLDRLMAVAGRKNYRAMGRAARNATMNNYVGAATQANSMAQSQGLSPAYQSAQNAGLGQNAARASASAENYYLDPRREQEDLAQLLQIISGAQSTNPYLNNILSAYSPVESSIGRNQSLKQSGGIFGGQLGSILGAALSIYSSATAKK
jgi:hypothetical protein